MTVESRLLKLMRRPGKGNAAGRSGRIRRHADYLLLPLGMALLLGLWEALVAWRNYPAFVLPAPSMVIRKIVLMIQDGSLLYHTSLTLEEIVLGLALGLVTATVLGYLVAKSRFIEHLLTPYVVASQAIPVVAIAPLFIIWFGFGSLSKILVCALTVFFPALVNTLVGLRSVDEDLRALMRSLNASRWQTFRMLEVPAAMPVLLGGLRVSVTLAVIGAVVGEFIGADRGLGFLINLARGTLDTPLLFATIIVLVVIAMALYLAVLALERVLLRWQNAK
jgi:NitT/TauT family transport system permease protein